MSSSVTPIVQSGTVTAGHVPVFVAPGVVGDGGASSSGSISSLGITNGGAGAFQINDGTTTSAYHALSLGIVTISSTANLDFSPFGGAAAWPMVLSVGGAGYVTLTPTGPVVAWPEGSVSHIGSGLTINAGTLESISGTGGTVTSIAAGAGLAGGTITTAGTLSLATIAAGELMGNYGTASAVPGGIAIGSGLSLNATGTLAATLSGAVTEVVAGTGLTGGTITGAGTVALAPLGAGLTLASGTLTPEWQAGTVTAVSGLTINAGTLEVTGAGGGTVTSVVAGPGLTGGTITASGTLSLASTIDVTEVVVGTTASEVTISQPGTDVGGLYPLAIVASGTNSVVPLVLAPQNGGYIAVNLPDGTTAGGNARGTGAVDFQQSRSSPLQVASGNYSFACGQNNQAGGSYSFAGGSGNYAGSEAFAFGSNCGANSAGGVVFGLNNTSSGESTVVAGISSQATGAFSLAVGSSINLSGVSSFGFGVGVADRGALGKFLFAGGASSGDAQHALSTLKAISATATARMTTDGNTAGATNSVPIPSNHVISGTLVITGRNTTNGDGANWSIPVLCKNVGGTVTVTQPGTAAIAPNYSDTSLSGASVTVLPDNTLKCLNVTITPPASTTLSASGVFQAAEM